MKSLHKSRNHREETPQEFPAQRLEGNDTDQYVEQEAVATIGHDLEHVAMSISVPRVSSQSTTSTRWMKVDLPGPSVQEGRPPCDRRPVLQPRQTLRQGLPPCEASGLIHCCQGGDSRAVVAVRCRKVATRSQRAVTAIPCAALMFHSVASDMSGPFMFDMAAFTPGTDETTPSLVRFQLMSQTGVSL